MSLPKIVIKARGAHPTPQPASVPTVSIPGSSSRVIAPPPADTTEDAGGEEDAMDVDSTAEAQTGDEEGNNSHRRQVKVPDEPPLGIYEPHTGLVICRADTQPTRSRLELLPDSGAKKATLGGTKAGNGAWGLAWVETVMDVEDPRTVEKRISEEKAALVQEALNDASRQPIVLT
ncbi:hypothetical protein H0H93_006090 [Arthromyces matolae]|nr:hypothetical protein H0H93_006090 [Arthromyces matolae]